MEEVIWAVVVTAGCGAVAGTALYIAIRGRSHTWRAAGIAYLVGAAGYMCWYWIVPDPPTDGTRLDIATSFGALGFLSILVGMVLTLVAIGQTGRRRFLFYLAAATLTIGTYQFWTTNWAARYADTRTRCTDYDHDFRAGTIRRLPPEVVCTDRGKEVAVPADGISWFALAAWSSVFGFAAAFPLMGVVWLADRAITTDADARDRVSPSSGRG